jgi:type VI protein secretion system component Hcp
MQLQRMAGNRAVAALIARDSTTKAPPAKPKKDPPKQNHVVISGMDPIVFQSAQVGGRQNPTSSSRAGQRETGAPQVAEIVITTMLGEHSTKLFQQSLRGEPFSAEIVFVDKDGKPYLTIKLKNAMISSYSVSGHGGGEDSKPMESWTLNADKIEYTSIADGAPAPGGY